ncbi:tripartite motif-containing protein 3-like [Glandiceps talaboti]
MATAAVNPDLEKIGKDFLTCSLCLHYYKNAKTLQCLHSYCEACLVTLLEKKGKLICPECRQDCCAPEGGVPQLGTNFLLNSLVEFVKSRELHSEDFKAGDITCEGCQEKVATSRCVDCAVNICQTCNKGHAIFRATRGHRMIAIADYKKTAPEPEQIAAYRPIPYCTVEGHEGNVLKLYCETCETPTCLECTVVNHRITEHKHQYLTEKAEEFLAKLKEKHEKLMQKEIEAKESVASATREVVAIGDLYHKRVEQVKKQVEDIIQKVRQDEEALLGQLKSEHEALKKHLECEIDRYEIAEKNLASTNNFVAILIRYGDAGEIVTGYEQATKRTAELLTDDYKHDEKNIFVDFKSNASLLDVDNIVGSIITVDLSETSRDRIPKIACVDETVKIDIKTKSSDGCLVPVNHTSAVVATLSTSGVNVDNPQKVKVTDHHDGIHSIELTIQNEGTYNLTIAVGSTPIKGSPFAIEVLSGPNLSTRLQKGTSVVRGKDWKWKEQDGNPPGSGTIYKVLSHGLILVKWNHGSTDTQGLNNEHREHDYYGHMSQYFKYRVGADNQYDVKPADFY